MGWPPLILMPICSPSGCLLARFRLRNAQIRAFAMGGFMTRGGLRVHNEVAVIDGERTTRVDGLLAVWRPTHDTRRGIEVMAVHSTGARPGAVRFAPGTDLADVRARHPEWDPLWDKVRHEFWKEIASPVGGAAVSARVTDHQPQVEPYVPGRSRRGEMR